MKLFKKSGKAINQESILRQKYAVFFSSDRLLKGISFTFVGWILIATSTVAFQHLVINNSIFVTLFYIFSSAAVPLVIWSAIKGKSAFICGKPRYVILRTVIAVSNYYTYFTSRTWISNSSNTFLFSIDTLFVPVLIYFVFRKKFSLLMWVGLLTGFFGLAVIYQFKLDIFSLQGMIDSLICLASGISMAWLIIVSCYIVRYDPALRQAMYTTLVGATFSGVAGLVTGWKQPSNIDLTYMVIQGLIYAVVLMSFLSACDCIEPHIVSCLSHFVPLLVVLINGAFNFYPISMITYIGSVITLTGMVLVVLSTRFQRREEDLLLS